jgi:osmotically-inducible protein OsmY
MKSDAQLKQDMIAELAWEPSVNAARIGVEVTDGIVTLAGHVDSFAEKWTAERVAERVAGVRALTVEIDVSLPGSSERSDVDIARAANDVLQWMTQVPKDQVKVMVENGWITLSGAVDWEYQRQAAKEAVRFLMGVKGVSDSLVIAHPEESPSVKAEIEAALRRRAKTDLMRIAVEVEAGNVTLSGVVDNWWDRELARNSAWGTRGVRNVVDHMTLSG